MPINPINESLDLPLRRHVSIPPQTHRALKIYVADKGKTIGQVIAEAVDLYLKREARKG